jgi:hypothetical protein
MNEGETRAMHLEQRHIAALNIAETLMFHSDFCPYLELKALLPDPSPVARLRFRSLFATYYGFNVGGLTEEFKDKFFAILHDGNVLLNEQPDFLSILNQLSGIKRKKGDYAMPFSFVSKLVAMHCEASPIYDKHVLAFFRKKASSASIQKAERIDWYVDFLNYVSCSYATWANDPSVAKILDRLKSRDSQLAKCHAVRLVDFLVWKVGNQRLLTK